MRADLAPVPIRQVAAVTSEWPCGLCRARTGRGVRALTPSFPQRPAIPTRYDGGAGPNPIGWLLGELT
jgi:hypothetical protein